MIIDRMLDEYLFIYLCVLYIHIITHKTLCIYNNNQYNFKPHIFNLSTLKIRNIST